MTLAPKETLDQIWADDRLGRRDDAAYIEKFLTGRLDERSKAGRTRSYVLNLDAGWGHGKTFFLTRLAAQLRGQGNLVAYVNAWRDDFAEDPLVSVMSAIDEQLSPKLAKKGALAKAYSALRENYGTILLVAAKGAAMQLLRKGMGDAADQLAGLAMGELATAASEAAKAGGEAAVSDIADRLSRTSIDEFERGRRSIADFQANLQKLLAQLSAEDVPMPLYVFVDELDRCRPTFAIAMLERVKHLFDAENVVFVIATDTSQLQHAIGAVYGSGFNAAAYLGRFFDRTYRFAQMSLADFVTSLMNLSPLDETKIAFFKDQSLAKYFTETFEIFGVGLRVAEQSYELVRTVVTTWTLPIKVQIGYLLPLAIAHVAGVDVPPGETLGRLNSSLPPTFRRPSRTGFEISYRVSSGEYQSDRVTPDGLFDHYFHASNRALRDLYGQEPKPTNRMDRLIYNELEDEFVRLHGNTSDANGGPHSVLQNYPEMVRRAGRLS